MLGTQLDLEGFDSNSWLNSYDASSVGCYSEFP